MLIEDTPIQDSALPLEAFKAHLRMGSGFGTEDLQDSVLLSFLRAAVAAIEVRTGKALFVRAFRWTVHGWRSEVAQVGRVQCARESLQRSRVEHELQARGYPVQEREGENSGLHVIVVNPDGLDGAADVRREGIVRSLPPRSD